MLTNHRHSTTTDAHGGQIMRTAHNSRKIVEIEHGHENDPVARSHAMTAYTVIAVIASICYSVAQTPLLF